MDNPEKQTKHKVTQQTKKTKLTNTGDMNTYAYKYRGYEHICLQIPGIWTHMLTNTGDMNTYAYKYRGYGHICLQIPGIHV